VPNNTERNDDQIHIEPVMYGNGWVAIVEVNGVVVQNDSDAGALCATREEAFEQGERRAREFIQKHC
jgi:hypothetical protein